MDLQHRSAWRSSLLRCDMTTSPQKLLRALARTARAFALGLAVALGATLATGTQQDLIRPAHAEGRALQVVATTEDLAAIAREVGGNRVAVMAICKGYQDPHFVDAKPSFM